MDPLAPFKEEPLKQRYLCYECGHVAKTVAGWHSHRRLQHNLTGGVLCKCPSTECPCCGANFRSYSRLQRHTCGAACGRYIRDHCPDLSLKQRQQQRADRLEQEKGLKKQGYDAAKALQPFTPGPASHKRPQKRQTLHPPKVDMDSVSHHCVPLMSTPMLPYRFAVHLYAGQRRDGDLQCELGAVQEVADFSAMISIDIVNGDKGDLTNWSHICHWGDMIVQGLVVLFKGESWSAAKQPAVRSREMLWDLDRLTAKEREQVRVGNVLLRSQQFLMWLCDLYHIPAMKEHPAVPTWARPEAPSSWLLPKEISLYSRPGNLTQSFNTCLLGAPYWKETTLGLVHFGELAQELDNLPNAGHCVCRGGRNTCGKKHVVLKGRDEAGRFMTTSPEQYTREFCRLIAVAAVRAWHRLRNACRSDINEAMQHVAAASYVPLDPYCEEQQWGHYGSDFHQHDDKRSHVGLVATSVSRMSAPCPVAEIPSDAPELTLVQREKIAANRDLAIQKQLS